MRIFTYEANELLLEAGVKLLFHTFICEAISKDNVIKGVVIQNKSGRQAVMGKVIVDCTGDGDVAASAGVPFTKGREEDGRMQPVTLMFRIGGVDFDTYRARAQENRGFVNDILEQASASGSVAPYTTHVMGFVQIPSRNEVVLNISNYPNVDGTNADYLAEQIF